MSWAAASLLAMSTAALAQEQAPARPAEGRGFLFGGGLNAGQIGFPGARGLSLAVGGVTSYSVVGTTLIEARSARVTPSGVPVAADRVVPFPDKQDAAGLVMEAGYAFSLRVAVLVDVEVLAPLSSESFSQVMGGFVVRYSPANRVWVQAGPASSEITYGFTNPENTKTGLPGVASVTEDGAVTGHGFIAAAGFSVLQKPGWSLDLQVRYGKCWYEGFQGTNFTFAVTAGRFRGKGAARS